MERLDRKASKVITVDWLALFPGFGVYQTRWIVRRCGPVVQGLLLDRDSSGDIYIPMSHVHVLLNDVGSMTLSLVRRLASARSGGPSWVKVRRHKEDYVEAAELIEKQSVLSLRRPLDLDEVVKAYRKDNEAPPPMDEYDCLHWEDELRLLVWRGADVEARRVCERYCDVLATWPDYVLERVGDLEEKRAEARAILGTQRGMAARMEEQAKLLELGI